MIPTKMMIVASFPNSSPVGKLLLEEKVPEIINISKVCFKSLSCSDSDGNKPDFVKSCCYLRNTIHCLRTVTPMLLTSSGAPEKNEKINDRVETAVKLLYHCILASEKISNDELKKEEENKASCEEEIVLHTAVICMAGYQVLGILLDMLLPGKLSSFLKVTSISMQNSWVDEST